MSSGQLQNSNFNRCTPLHHIKDRRNIFQVSLLISFAESWEFLNIPESGLRRIRLQYNCFSHHIYDPIRFPLKFNLISSCNIDNKFSSDKFPFSLTFLASTSKDKRKKFSTYNRNDIPWNDYNSLTILILYIHNEKNWTMTKRQKRVCVSGKLKKDFRVTSSAISLFENNRQNAKRWTIPLSAT